MGCVILVKAGDAPVPPSGGRWLDLESVAIVNEGHRFGRLEIPSAGKFYHVAITDRDRDSLDMQAYLEPVMAGEDMIKRRRLSLNPAAPITLDLKSGGTASWDFNTLQSVTVSYT